MELDLLVMELSAESKRFAEIFNEKGWKQEELGKALGYKDHTTVNLYLNGKREIADSFLLKLQEKFGVSRNFIRNGTGPRYISEENNLPEARVVGVFDPDVFQQVRIIRYRVWASFVDNFDEFNFDEVDDTVPVYLPSLSGPITDKHMVFEILGDSMEPTLLERAKVLAELVDDGNYDYMTAGVYIVAYRNQMVTKRIIDNDLLLGGTLVLHSDNVRRGKILIRKDDIRKIWRVTDIIGSKVR